MRKSTIVYEIRYLYELLEIERAADRTIGGNTYRIISNWKNLNTALYKLNEYEFIGDSVKKIFDLGVNFQASTESTSVLASEYDKFINLLNIVKAKCCAIIDLYNVSDSTSLELFMKLPDDISDLKELSTLISEINVSFNMCPILSDKVGRISFERVEEGSNWLVFLIELSSGLAAASKSLEWFANFIYKCNEIRLQKRTIKDKDLDIMLKRLQIEDKEYEKLIKKYYDSLQVELREVCIKKFKELEFSSDIDITPEEQTKIVHSMKTLIDVLEKGTEFYPSSATDENIQKMFPKQEEFKQIENVKKLIENLKQEE